MGIFDAIFSNNTQTINDLSIIIFYSVSCQLVLTAVATGFIEWLESPQVPKCNKFCKQSCMK